MAERRAGPLRTGNIGSWSLIDLLVWLRGQGVPGNEVVPGYRVIDLTRDLSDIAEALVDEEIEAREEEERK